MTSTHGVDEVTKVTPTVKTVSSVSHTTPAAAPASTSSSASSRPPRLVRSLVVVLVLSCVCAQIPSISKAFVNAFALLPVATIGQSKLWNVVTAGFLDTSAPAAALNIALIATAGKWIEASWGSRSLLLYILLINFLSGSLTYVTMLFMYAITRSDVYFFRPIATTNGISLALLVAIKQLIADHQIGLTAVPITTNFLPLIYISIVAACAAFSIVSFGVIVFSLFALHLSWMYLRFFRFNTNTSPATPPSTEYGDLSDAFAYVTLFPEVVRPPIAIVANVLFLVFKPLVMVVQNFASNANSGANSNAATGKDSHHLQSSSTASTMDIERRRLRALKVLDDRMQTYNTSINSDSIAPKDSSTDTEPSILEINVKPATATSNESGVVNEV